MVDSNEKPVPDYDLADRIDHIFVGPNGAGWQVERWVVDLYVYGQMDRYPSDHRAMFAKMTAPEM